MRCHYNSNSRLKSFIVRPPVVYANINSRLGQNVGWRVIIQRKVYPGAWKTIFRSGQQHRTAATYVGAPAAPFVKRTLSPRLPHDAKPLFTDYRVMVQMFWYRPNGTIKGKAKHLVDYYRDDQLDETSGPGSACSRETGVF